MIWRVSERKMTGRRREQIVQLEVSADELETLTKALAPAPAAAVDILMVDLTAAEAALATGEIGRRGGRL